MLKLRGGGISILVGWLLLLFWRLLDRAVRRSQRRFR